MRRTLLAVPIVGATLLAALLSFVVLIFGGNANATAVMSAAEAEGMCPGPAAVQVAAAPARPVTGTGVGLAVEAVRAAGWPREQWVKAVAVAGAESSYNPKAGNRLRDGRTHVGLFQISSLHTEWIAKHGGDRTDPVANAKMALEVWKAQGWNAWTVTTGYDTPGNRKTYLGKMSEAQAAVDSLDGAPAPTRPAVAAAVATAECEPEVKQDDHSKAPAGTNNATSTISCTVGGQGQVELAPGGVEIRVCSVGPFVVDTTIASQVHAMVNAAAADGLTLGGSAFRSNKRQQELRVINGCPDVFTAKSRTCRVPTAIPGQSQHEWGRALDITCNGPLIRSRGNKCHLWLKANAAKYGLFPLASEPWHWSVDGT